VRRPQQRFAIPARDPDHVVRVADAIATTRRMFIDAIFGRAVTLPVVWRPVPRPAEVVRGTRRFMTIKLSIASATAKSSVRQCKLFAPILAIYIPESQAGGLVRPTLPIERTMFVGSREGNH